MLSRLAEDVYWAGRYVERAEATARLVAVHTELYLDLPLSAGLGWSPLLAVTGSGDEFGRRYEAADEDSIVQFLTADGGHLGSVVSSLRLARENLRRTRSLLPRAAWEVLNELHFGVHDRADAAVDRRTRLSWTDQVVRGCQLFNGVIAGTMSHDQAYCFLDIGRNLERADLTTHVLDVQASILLGPTSAALEPYADVTWMSVLRTLSARQVFRRTASIGLSGSDALSFLLRDPQFPRSVEHCLTQVSQALLELPSNDAPMHRCAEVQQLLEDTDAGALDAAALHEFVDELQLGIAALHDVFADRYFPPLPAAATDVAVPVTA
jgi:uncharacterized alpha-E superfamily protein